MPPYNHFAPGERGRIVGRLKVAQNDARRVERMGALMANPPHLSAL